MPFYEAEDNIKRGCERWSGLWVEGGNVARAQSGILAYT